MSALKQTWESNKSQVFGIIKSEYESGSDLNKIASRLNSLGLKSKNNKAFSKSIVCAIALYELNLKKRVEQSKHVFKKKDIEVEKEPDVVNQNVNNDVQVQPSQVFNFENLDIRTITKDDGSIWFCVKDVCSVLELNNHREAVSNIKDNHKVVVPTDTLGGLQNMLFISEAGLYKLIFVSRKENAEKFQDWITSDVIPSIRKTGSYSINQPKELTRLELLELAIQSEKEKLKLQAEKEQAERIALENKNQRLLIEKKNAVLKQDNENLQSRAVLFDAFTATTELKSLKQLGYKLKRYGLGGKKIFQLLRDEKILTRVNGENYPTAEYDKYFAIDTVVKSWTDKTTNKEKSRAFDVLKATKEFYPVLGSLLIKKGYLQLSDWQLIDFNNCPKDSEIFDDSFQ